MPYTATIFAKGYNNPRHAVTAETHDQAAALASGWLNERGEYMSADNDTEYATFYRETGVQTGGVAVEKDEE